MKKFILGISCAYLFSFAVMNNAAGGSLSTSGQGARALAMGGAFTAVADDGSAVYYNPAGITQIDGTSLTLGVAQGEPSITYKTPSGAAQESSKNWQGYWFFVTHAFTDKLSGGLGIYSPFARDAEFKADLANNFAAQRSSVYRLDISPVLSYRLNPAFSMSGGLVLGYSEVDQLIPAGPGTSIKDTMDGWGMGGVISAFVSVNENVKLGFTYRSRMITDYSGSRQLETPMTVIDSDAEADGKWPATMALGIAWQATNTIKLSFDTHWTEWSYVNKIVTKTETLGDSTTQLDQRDTWDYRIGGEWEFKPGWFLRGGYSRIAHSLPSSTIIPSKPDADGDAFQFGMGKAWQYWDVDFVYEIASTDTISATDNIYGFTGDYQIDQSTVALTASYRFQGHSR